MTEKLDSLYSALTDTPVPVTDEPQTLAGITAPKFRGASRHIVTGDHSVLVGHFSGRSGAAPSLMIGLARLLGAKRVYDSHAASERMLGAIAGELACYVGVNPDDDVRRSAQRVASYTKADPARYYIAPELRPGDFRYDLVFGDSSVWDHVSTGGYLASPRPDLKLPDGAEYAGIITWGRPAQPLHLWYRTPTATPAIDPKRFEILRFRHMSTRETIERAFAIVRDYIVKHGRLLGGGMSVDLAMRTKGAKLYSEDTLPDYDFLSPQAWGDAYAIARLLCEARIPDVDVIGAMHITTNRVRVGGIVVADATYVPQAIYDTMYHVAVGGMRLLHPWYTQLDQFTALAMPYENPPREVIRERWAKDIKRLHLIQPLYPIPQAVVVPTEMYELTIPAGDCIVTGWAALAYYNREAGWGEEKIATRYADDRCRIPQRFVAVMTDNWESFVDSKMPVQYFNSMMGFPRHLETPNMHVHDTLGLKIGILAAGGRIASLPALMWYFMHRWLRFGDATDQYGANLTWEHIQIGKWPLGIHTYGAYIWNQAFVHYLREFRAIAGEKTTRPPHLSFPGDQSTCDAPTPAFDPSRSRYFIIDGSPCERWELSFPLEDLAVRTHGGSPASDSPSDGLSPYLD